MADNNDFSRHVKIKKEYKEIDKKLDFLNKSIKSGANFIYVAFRHNLSFFDLKTIDDEFKFFYLIPYNSFVDNEWSHLAFRSKLDLDKLLELLVFYDADFPKIDAESFDKYWLQPKIS